MTRTSPTTAPGHRARGGRRTGIFAGLASGAIATAVALLMVAGSQPAYAAEAPVGLGNATPFAVLAGTTVTNTGPTVVSGDLGVSPGTAITGFPPGQVINGAQHSADAVALQAQNDLVTAYNDAAGRTPATAVSSDLGGQVLVGGVYNTAAAMSLTGTVTLDGQGDPNTVFIFQAGSTLTTATSSTVALVNGAQACNVFWQVGSSATVGTSTTFVGSIMALTTITLQTQASVAGRVLARNGAVNLDTNTITRPTCAVPPTTATPTTATPTTTTATPSPTATATATPTPTTTTTATPTSTPTSTPTAGEPTRPGDTNTGSGGGPGGPGGPNDDSSTGYPVPTGHPETGLGGPDSPGQPMWIAFGLVALAGSALAGSRARRSSRTAPPAG